MFSDTVINFLQTYQQHIVRRWRELAEGELSPDFTGADWFSETALARLHEQLIEALQSRVYQGLNRTIEQLTRAPGTPSPLEVKDLLRAFSQAAFEEFELREDTLRDARKIRGDLKQIGRTLKQVYSERLCPDLLTVLAEHRDDVRERWIRDLPTARISDHFSMLSEHDLESFVDQTMEVYEAMLRGREEDSAPHPEDPNLACTVYEAWIIRQVEYFTPKGFDVVDLMRAVDHLRELLEPLLARGVGHDAWTYRVSVLMLEDVRNTLVNGIAEAYVEKFSKNFYGEVGIMLHRIKNKLTSVPSTMRTVLAIADGEYDAMFDPMVLTDKEAEIVAAYEGQCQELIAASRQVAAGDADGAAALQAALAALDAFLAEHGETLTMVQTMKLDVAGAEMLREMLDIVFEGGNQTQELTQELQLRMNEMYEREPARREPLDLSQLLQAATEEAAVDARAKNIDFQVRSDCDDLRIFGVKREIARPFVQVIDNAIKYTPEGGDVIVELGRDGDDHVLFSVKDSGIGIPAGEEEQVFSLCERCSNAKDFAQGTGTGLYHDRITVMHHNGEMWCESEGVGKGSKFYIRLPIYRETAEQAAGD